MGPAIAMLLSPPEKVQRSNGTKVQLIERVADGIELKETLKLMLRKEFIFL